MAGNIPDVGPRPRPQQPTRNVLDILRDAQAAERARVRDLPQPVPTKPSVSDVDLNLIAPFPPRGGPPTFPARRPDRPLPFDILRSGQDRLRGPFPPSERQLFERDVREFAAGLGGVGAIGAGVAGEGGEDGVPGPVAATRQVTRPVGNSLDAIRRRLANNQRETNEALRRDLDNVIEFGEDVLDFFGPKGAKDGSAVLARNFIEIAPGIKGAPGLEIGAQIFTGTAGAGEENAIALILESERADRARLAAVRSAGPTLRMQDADP